MPYRLLALGELAFCHVLAESPRAVNEAEDAVDAGAVHKHLAEHMSIHMHAR